jgi:hypothetical protein
VRTRLFAFGMSRDVAEFAFREHDCPNRQEGALFL